MTRTTETNPRHTGPMSGGAFALALESEATRANHAGGELGLILFALDDLHGLYDRVGRPTAEALLDHLGHHIARRVRSHDLFGRLTEGEFALITRGMDLGEVTGCAVKLRHLVRDFEFNRIGRVCASFGVTHFLPGESVALLQARARRALDRARAAGGNRVSAARATA